MNEKLSGEGHLAVSVDVKGPTCLDPGCRQLPWECPGLPVRFFPGQIRTVASVCVHLHCALYIEKTFQSRGDFAKTDCSQKRIFRLKAAKI